MGPWEATGLGRIPTEFVFFTRSLLASSVRIRYDLERSGRVCYGGSVWSPTFTLPEGTSDRKVPLEKPGGAEGARRAARLGGRDGGA